MTYVRIKNIAATHAANLEGHDSFFAGRLLAVHDEGRVRSVIFEDGNSCRTKMTLAEIDEAVANAKRLKDFD